MPSIPHLDWPVRLNGAGSMASNEQDSIDDIATCVAISMLTPPGFRPDEPDFGSRLDFPLLPVDLAALSKQVSRDEPRAQLTMSDEPRTRQDLELRITARLTQARGAS